MQTSEWLVAGPGAGEPRPVAYLSGGARSRRARGRAVWPREPVRLRSATSAPEAPEAV